MRPIFVGIFGSHRMVREEIARTLARKKNIKIVEDEFDIGVFDGEVASAEAELSAAILRSPKMRPIVLLFAPDPKQCVRWIRLGAWGIVQHMTYKVDLQLAIISVSKQRPWFTIDLLRCWANSDSWALDKKFPQLTSREREVMALITSKSLCNKEIASILNISERTVKFHIGNVFRKLHVSSRNGLNTTKLPLAS